MSRLYKRIFYYFNVKRPKYFKTQLINTIPIFEEMIFKIVLGIILEMCLSYFDRISENTIPKTGVMMITYYLYYDIINDCQSKYLPKYLFWIGSCVKSSIMFCRLLLPCITGMNSSSFR